MRGSLWTLVLVAAALGLCGCSNYVYSDTPLFTARDSRNLPRLRPGIWSSKIEEGCTFDEASPLKDWPECAGGRVLGDDPRRAVSQLSDGEGLLVGGDPLILQMAGKETGEQTSYHALRVTRFDERRRAVEFSVWAVQCGPPTPPDPKFPDRTTLTQSPLPGLEIRDKNCIARDPDTVRAAAKASEAWTASPTLFRWVRDGRR